MSGTGKFFELSNFCAEMAVEKLAAEKLESYEPSAVKGKRLVFLLDWCNTSSSSSLHVTVTHYHLASSLGWKRKWNIVRIMLISFRSTWEISKVFMCN